MDEVQSLIARGYSPSLPTMSAIGYREGAQALEGQITVEEAKLLTRRATRVFIRRQANWFKESDSNILWFRVEDGIADEIEKNIRRLVDF